MRRALTVIAALLACTLLTGADWPTNHGSGSRSGYAPGAHSFGGFHWVYTKNLDAAVYGSPILVGGRLIVATENNTVYAFTAATGALLWTRHLRSAISDTSVLACPGNIPRTGITGSPAYDPVTGRVFVVTISRGSGGVFHEVWGLRAGDGATAFTHRADVPGTDPKANQQRGALLVANSKVYITYGGLAGDCGNYKGAVLAFPTSGALTYQHYVVPTGREAGIWAPGGPVLLPRGNLLVATGNGESTSGAYDLSDSVTKLDRNLKRIDLFAPTTWASDNADDKDLGSLTPVLLGNGLVLQAGKSGKGYTMNANHLGGIGGQLVEATLCRAFGVAAVYASDAFLPCTDGVKRVAVAADGRITVRWTAPGVPGSPVVGPSVVYSLDGATLHALRSSDGVTMGTASIGNTSRFATPALDGNRIYVPTLAGVVALNVS